MLAWQNRKGISENINSYRHKNSKTWYKIGPTISSYLIKRWKSSLKQRKDLADYFIITWIASYLIKVMLLNSNVFKPEILKLSFLKSLA